MGTGRVALGDGLSDVLGDGRGVAVGPGEGVGAAVADGVGLVVGAAGTAACRCWQPTASSSTGRSSEARRTRQPPFEEKCW